MAGSKGRKKLDQPDGGILSALDRALADLGNNGIVAADEFTLPMVMANDPQITETTANRRLSKMEKDGLIAHRKAVINGHSMRVYRYVN
jgi:DNA-binding Lrp family transcriptional regulator